MDERIKKLAYNLVNYSVKVKEGEKVYVHYIGNDTQLTLQEQSLKKCIRQKVFHKQILLITGFFVRYY